MDQKLTIKILRIVGEAMIKVSEAVMGEPDPAPEAPEAPEAPDTPVTGPGHFEPSVPDAGKPYVPGPGMVDPPMSAPITGMETIEVDSEGFPWDSRIHGSGKTKYQKKTPNGEAGTWKLKRGVDPEYVKEVKAQLRQQHPVPCVPPAAPGSTPAPEHKPAPSEAGAPPAPPVPSGDLPAYGTYTTWGGLMREITGRQMPAETVTAACQAHDVADVAALQNSPNAIPAVAATLGLTAPQGV